MAKTKINFREERDMGQKLNATFAFIRQHFKPLMSCVLLFVVPFSVLAGIFSGIYQSRLLDMATGEPTYRTWGEFNFLTSINSFHYLSSLFFTYVGIVVFSLTIYTYLVRFMDHGKPVGMPEVWEGIKNHFLTFFISFFGVLVLTMMGFMVLLIPGIYLGTAFSLIGIIMVREDLGFVDAIERCLYLVKGHWWTTFGFLIIVSLIQGLMGMVAGAPVLVLTMLKALQLPGGDNNLLLVIGNTLGTTIYMLLYIIMGIAMAFQYFNLVEIKDGTGYLEQVALIGGNQDREERDENQN